MDHCYLKQHGTKKNTKMFWRSLSILLHHWANYLDSLKNSARPFVFGEANRSPSQNHFCNRAISWHASSTQPVVQAVFVVGFRQETVTVRVFPQNYQYRHCRFHGEVGVPRLFGAKIHCIEFGLVGQTLRCACLILSHSKCRHG